MRNLLVAIRHTLTLWLITALIYPALMLLIGQLALPYQANGSLITDSAGKIIGSALIGQNFTSNTYFWSRPSTINYSQDETASPTGVSGASNLAPSNPDLTKRITQEIQRLKSVGVTPTADLVYTSGSGLDPHITVAGAIAQLPRVAKATNIPESQIKPLIATHTQGKFLGIFGEPSVNVLQLNLALEALKR
ncbi:K(+)-transporting ATPase subunit C [Merismopedia glauca]|uniref:Potassium-transporting ATPase KdpC subunit n=1 Tax=Merismopedia glauca CCAP 1448/3 TaxID=1296344 RepID=A0A2T1BZ71_9CYAN|nr:K(+)-transporting ATPase subunit C [Merismopedia glauca]PSB01208.1 potassium-transporting ATPase subunit C [Merismopedia glauca CCAP 1448/3]